MRSTGHDDTELQIVTVAGRQPQSASSHANGRMNMCLSNARYSADQGDAVAHCDRICLPRPAIAGVSATAPGGSLRVRRYAHHGRRPAQAGAARPLSTPQDTAAAGRAVTRCSQARGAKQAHPHLPQLPCTSAGGGANSEHFAEYPCAPALVLLP